MTERQMKPTMQRSATTESETSAGLELHKQREECKGKLRKAVSMDSGEAEVKQSARRIVRRRISKRLTRPELEFGHNTEEYERIRERVLQERAVINAIDALQERWNTITFIYEDCVQLNEIRRQRKLRKQIVQRQFELIIIVFTVLLICLPISVVLIYVFRCATTDSFTVEGTELSGHGSKPHDRIRKSASMDSGETAVVTKSLTASTGSLIRRSVRKRKLGRPEPEFGQDITAYVKIRERVLEERAVTNAIDALQERWRMIMYMYDDCVELNEKRKERKLRKLCIKRQYELIMIVSLFFLIVLPVTIALVLINRYLQFTC